MKEERIRLIILVDTAGYEIKIVTINVMAKDKIIAVQDITICEYAEAYYPAVATDEYNQITSTYYAALGIGGVIRNAHTRFSRIESDPTTCKFTCNYTISNDALYCKYLNWYNTYVEHYSRGIILMHDKPPLTLNAFILLNKRHYSGSEDRVINYKICQTSPGCWYYLSDLDTPYTPYVREYSKLRGVLTVYRVYSPDRERAHTRPIAYPVASDMHFAMLGCKTFADVAFEWRM